MHTYKINYKYRLHTVRHGETFESIAEKYNTSPPYIKKQNKLKASLSAGDMLYIGGLDRKTYIVQPLDTLESIAKKHSADIISLRLLNDIENVYIGQRILI